ncbi:MAG: YesL family protein [Lachnospiraceae bacterium]|nr:YesL family protein [Lachnospiraceae bacterium]
MGKFFDLDSPLMRGLSRMADLVWVNLLVLICVVPALVVFTVTLELRLPTVPVLALTYLAALLIGPALTGMHYILLKMVRDEEGYITRSFFKSFRENFRQSVILAAIVLAVAALVAGDVYLLTTEAMSSIPRAFRIAILVIAIYMFMIALWIFPIEARFVNTVMGTIRNAFLMAMLAFPRTLGMAAMTLVPVILYYFFGMRLFPILLMFAVSAPGYVCALLYNKTFKRFEPEAEEAPDEEFRVAEAPEDTAPAAEEEGNDAE